MIRVCFQSKPFNITVIQVYAPTINAEEAEVKRFCVREAQPSPARRAIAPESHGAAPSPPPAPLLQVIPNYSSRTEYEKLFAMGVTM